MIHYRKHFEKLYFDEFLFLRVLRREGECLNVRQFRETLAEGAQIESTLMMRDILLQVVDMSKYCELFAVSAVETGASEGDPALGHLREDAQYGINLCVRCLFWALKSLNHILL